MKLGIIDYHLCRGGGERFVLGVLNSLPEDIDITIFSADSALEGFGIGGDKNFRALGIDTLRQHGGDHRRQLPFLFAVRLDAERNTERVHRHHPIFPGSSRSSC